MTTYLDDRKLAKRLLAGEARTFEAFFDDNYARVYRFALSRLGGGSGTQNIGSRPAVDFM